MRRLRVLHIVQNLNYGGMERLIAEMLPRLDATRFEMHVLALHYLGHFSEGLEQHATLHIARPLSRWSMLRPSSLAADIRVIAPDVVHTHSGIWYKVSLAARMAGVPFLVHTDHGRRNPDPWSDRVVDGIASRRTNVVVAVSERLAEQLRHIVPDPTRIRLIRNGVDTALYAPLPGDGALHRELGIDPRVPIIGSVGRLVPIKGYDVMIAAFARLVREWPDDTSCPQLVLVGDGSERSTLERAAATAGCRGTVHFLGWRSDIRTCHQAFTLFTMSSRSEGTSVSLLEAMSAGLCPIVTDVGGNAAVLGEALCHRLVASERPDALAAAWRQALGDEGRQRCDAAAARARIVQHFNLDSMVRAYERVYDEASASTEVWESTDVYAAHAASPSNAHPRAAT